MKKKKSIIRNTRQSKMGIRSAVSYAEAQIMSERKGFFVNSEFGRIAFECNGFVDNSPLHPVVIMPWTEAPGTQWAKAQQNEDCQMYISIDTYDSELSDHLTVIEAMSRAMFMSLGFEDSIPDEVVDAAVQIYIQNYDSLVLTINEMEDEFFRNHVNWFRGTMAPNKTKDLIHVLVKELFTIRLDAANRIVAKARTLVEDCIRTGKVSEDTFQDDYSKEIYGLLLYINGNQKEQAELLENRLEDFSNTWVRFGLMVKNN